MSGTCLAHVCAQVQCVTHFLQLPIEDEFMEDLMPKQALGVAMSNDGPALRPEEQPIPFADTGNPVMAQARVADSLFRSQCSCWCCSTHSLDGQVCDIAIVGRCRWCLLPLMSLQTCVPLAYLMELKKNQQRWLPDFYL